MFECEILVAYLSFPINSRIVFVYRPPNVDPRLSEQFFDLLSFFLHFSDHNIVIGDSNCKVSFKSKSAHVMFNHRLNLLL